jgi:hypothetical protein
MISALPIFLKAITGKSAVWSWFTKEARLGADQYMWDPDKGVVGIPKNQEDEEDKDAEATTEEDIDGWEDLKDGNDIGDNNDHIFHPFELDLNKLGANPYDDDGTFKTSIYEDRSVVVDIQDNNDNDLDPPDAKNRAQPFGAKHQRPVIIDCDEETAVSPSNSKKTAKPRSINTATTASSKTPSTLTKTPDRSTMISELAADPAFASDPLMAEAFKKLALHLKGQTGLTSETDCDAVDV